MTRSDEVSLKKCFTCCCCVPSGSEMLVPCESARLLVKTGAQLRHRSVTDDPKDKRPAGPLQLQASGRLLVLKLLQYGLAAGQDAAVTMKDYRRRLEQAMAVTEGATVDAKRLNQRSKQRG